MAANFDPNMLTAPFQLTKGMHRDVYPAIDPKKFASLAADKVVVVTGAGGGLGYVRFIKHDYIDLLTNALIGCREDLDWSWSQRCRARRPRREEARNRSF